MINKHILIIDSYEIGQMLVRNMLLQLGKQHHEIVFATDSEEARKKMLELKKEGKRCLVISDSLVRSSHRVHGPYGRQCTSELIKEAIGLGYDVGLCVAGPLSEGLQELVEQGVHCVTKRSEHLSDPQKFYDEIVAPILAKNPIIAHCCIKGTYLI